MHTVRGWPATVITGLEAEMDKYIGHTVGAVRRGSQGLWEIEGASHSAWETSPRK